MSANIPASPTEVQVSVDGETVVCRLPGGAALQLTPERAAELAERLWSAAEAARAGSAPEGDKVPFPPADLVSRHAAG
jgi:hypothetical protein